MRVDLGIILKLLEKSGEKGAKLHERIAKIAELEQYTLLAPPYNAQRVKHLIAVAEDQEALGFKFPKAYVNLMQCFDGGWLFEHQIFSVDDEDDPDNDLIEANLYYREEKMIPEGTVAIGRTNYGGFIVIRADGSMGLWVLEEGWIAEFGDLYAWLDDVLAEAHYLLENGGMTVIEDDEDDTEDNDG